ncbi:MAG: NlpC/P60 family protein [Planktomarina sp.]
MNFMEWVQTRLITHGFNPGVVDGIWGRKTLGAVKAFQSGKGLNPSGRLDEATVAALRVMPGTADVTDNVPSQDLLDKFPWMEVALRKKGLHEQRDNIELREFLASDGPTLGDPAQLPWCGDFVETCAGLTLPDAVLPTNPYLARNWLLFGQTVEPVFGSILVFWRGSRSGFKGHVGFYYSEDDDNYHVLGGNQRNTISVTSISKSRLLGARLPDVGGPYPRQKVRSAADWVLSTNEA